MSVDKIIDHLFLTFPVRRTFLIFLTIIGLVPLSIVLMLPASLRLTYAYFVTTVVLLGLYLTLGKFSQMALDTIWSVIPNRKYKNVESDDPLWRDAVKQYGITKPVRFFTSYNPKLGSAFTNPISRKIYFPEKWFLFSKSEQLSVIGHELDHIQSFKRFVGQLVLVALLILGLIFVLSYLTAPFFVTISTISLDLLLISYFARRNEMHADYESGIKFGPEGLISVFEILKERENSDRGSETHPPLSKRISKLYELIENEEDVENEC